MAAKKKVTAKAAPVKEAAKAAKAANIEAQEIVRKEVVEDVQLRRPDKRKVFREFAAALNKDGRKVVAMANEAPNTYELRRPTGIMQLDIDIGGGFPAGGMSIISGPDNAGKTYMMLKAMAMHQLLYREDSALAFASAEGAFDYKRALATGLLIEVPDEILNQWNMERTNLGLPEYTDDEIRFFKRQWGEFYIIRAHTGEELMNVVLEAVKKNIFHIIGVDSFSVLLPEADEAKDVGETPKRAGNANLMTDFIRKYSPHTSGLEGTNYTTLLGIMQVRANEERANAGPLAKYLKEWRITGAWATKHGKLVDITIWDGATLKKKVDGVDTVYGKALNWRIEKGKAGCHDNVVGETQYRYDIPLGHDDIGSIIINGIRRGVFTEEGGKIQIYHPITRKKTDLGGFPNYNALGRVMAEDFEFELQMRTYVLAAAGVQCLYRL